MSKDIPVYDEIDNNNGYYQVIQKKLNSAINGDEYECDESLLSMYVDSVLEGLTEEELLMYDTLNEMRISFWPVYAIVFFGAESPNFYPDDQQTNMFNKALNDQNAFWDTKSEDIKIHSWTARLLVDEPDLILQAIMFLEALGEDGLEEAQAMYDEAIAIMQDYPAIGFDFPLHSLNAFAFRGPPSIIGMGKCF